jgi:hypothetical protein
VTITSSRTGNVITFAHLTTLWRGVGSDREIVGWRYTTPRLAGWRVEIFNT